MCGNKPAHRIIVESAVSQMSFIYFSEGVLRSLKHEKRHLFLTSDDASVFISKLHENITFHEISPWRNDTSVG